MTGIVIRLLKIAVLSFTFLGLISCSSTPKVIVNPSTIKDEHQYKKDEEECIKIAKTYDLSKEKEGKVVAGALIGGATVAGVATAVAGAVFAPAIPFIIAGGLVGGGLWGASISKEEAQAREKILIQCLKSKKYEVYGVQ